MKPSFLQCLKLTARSLHSAQFISEPRRVLECYFTCVFRGKDVRGITQSAVILTISSRASSLQSDSKVKEGWVKFSQVVECNGSGEELERSETVSQP